MMRRLSYWLLSILLLVACVKENQEQEQPAWDGPVIELELSCVNPSDPTKAGSNGTESGENPYHENDIKWVDFYFYPDGATSQQATYHVRKTSGRRDNDVFRVELTTNQVNYLIFPVHDNITEATVFAIANAPEGTLENLEDTSLDNILAQVISANFAWDKYLNHRQEQFVMSGQTSITLAGRSQKMVSQGVVELARYASKITVGIKTEDKVEVERKDADGNPYTEVWTPRLWSMQLYLMNGVNKVALSGSPAGTTGGITPQGEDYFGYDNNRLAFFDENKVQYFDKSGDFYNTFPMYTYPSHWNSGDEKEPYLKLVMTWDRQPSGQHEFYYKILIPQDRRGGEFLNSFVRNNWYHYDIEVGVLGAETDEEAVELQASMYIVDWQEKEVVVNKASIGNARYLSVEDTEFSLYNQPALSIKYTTSNPIKITNIHVTRPYYGEDQTTGYNTRYKGDVKQVSHSDEFTYDDIYPDGSFYLEYSEEQRKALAPDGEDWLQIMSKTIEFTHALNNDYTSSSFDYSPYTITFDVGHAESSQAWMAQYNKHVTIVQYPGLSIKATQNPDTWTGQTGTTTPDHWGYVYVDKGQYTRVNYEADLKNVPTDQKEAWKLDHIWRVVHYSSGGTDMYRIDVSVLPEGSEFVLGDPRQSTPADLRPEGDYAEGFAEAYALKDGEIEATQRSLEHYYPTEASERTRNMLAPAYRISTKLSGSEYDGTPLEQAKMRCASLQENGFPAGRWRLPTEGEVRFISMLSTKEVFEWQFGGNYWSANGAVKVDKNNKTVTPITVDKALLRCVYDSWYWGDDRVVAGADEKPVVVKDNSGEPKFFVWGDAAR